MGQTKFKNALANSRKYYATGTSRVGMGPIRGVGGPNGPGQTITNGSWDPNSPQAAPAQAGPQPAKRQNQDLRAKLFPVPKRYADGTDFVSRPTMLPASVGGGSSSKSAMALREEIARRRAARADAPKTAQALPPRSYSSGPPRASRDAWLPSHGAPPQPPLAKDTPVVDVRRPRAAPGPASDPSKPEFRPLKGDPTEPPLQARSDRSRAPANAPDTYGMRQTNADRATASAKISAVRDAIRSGQRFDKGFDKLRADPSARSTSDGTPPKGAIAETAEDFRRLASSKAAKIARGLPAAPRDAPRPRNAGFGQRVPTPMSSPAGPSMLDRVRSAISSAAGAVRGVARGDNDYAEGTQRVPGRLPKRGTTDVVPAMLTPGEAVLNRGAAKAMGRSKIAAANARGSGAPMSGIERAMHAHADKCHPVGAMR